MTGSSDFGFVHEYWQDAFQRSVLFLDILRQRGNNYLAKTEQTAPNVLHFQTELMIDGRSLEKPVNYGLVRVVPPEGTVIKPYKPPIIVIDPRAGHGPGIGGMKQESEIGVALAAGHACYFIGFLPDPVEGQTVEDVCAAEAVFIREVAKRHAEAEGKPIIIANCQAGWQVMMTAALNPDVSGPLILAGSPLSYWQGHRGKNPLRYLGGLLGGTWLTSLSGDLGAGIFDGAHLVANFESLNLANTYWEKPYNVYSKVDTEGTRFLDFEAWWGNPVTLNAQEMQWIADNLFVGNRLATGGIRTSNRSRIDLRNVKGPIIIFCSWGDNITPPPQALGWITDIYDHGREIAEAGQTIVYCLHADIGHLGIFVSGKVANKEHDEFVRCMDMIDLMPPGLYEAVISEVEPDAANPELINGRYLFRLEQRKLSDIKKLCGPDNDDERFATVARLSKINKSMYRTLARPVVRSLVTPDKAAAMREMHPNRVRFRAFSDKNPMMKSVERMAEQVRANRKPVSPDNPLLALQNAHSAMMSMWLEGVQQWRDLATEIAFLGVYGSPVLQSLVGLGDGDRTPDARRIERDLVREMAVKQERSDLLERVGEGGPIAAIVRAIIYIRIAEGTIDERGFTVLKTLQAAQPAEKRLSVAQMKDLIRDQYFLLRLDEHRAVSAISQLLQPASQHERRQALNIVHDVIKARGTPSPETAQRLAEIDEIFAATTPANANADDATPPDEKPKGKGKAAHA